MQVHQILDRWLGQHILDHPRPDAFALAPRFNDTAYIADALIVQFDACNGYNLVAMHSCPVLAARNAVRWGFGGFQQGFDGIISGCPGLDPAQVLVCSRHDNYVIRHILTITNRCRSFAIIKGMDVPPDQPVDGQESKPDSATPPPRPPATIAIVGVALAFLLPPVGALISIVAWRQAKKQAQRTALAVAGTVIGIAFTLPIIGVVWLLVSLGWLKGNQAQKEFKPIGAAIQQAGGHKICDNGDTGYGIDNNVPWYEAYYSIPDSDNLTSTVKNIAAEQGYKLSTDNQGVKQLQDSSDTALSGDERFNPGSDYLTAKKNHRTLSATVNRHTSLSLHCSSGQYGRQQSTGNDAIIDFDLRLPPTNQPAD